MTLLKCAAYQIVDPLQQCWSLWAWKLGKVCSEWTSRGLYWRKLCSLWKLACLKNISIHHNRIPEWICYVLFLDFSDHRILQMKLLHGNEVFLPLRSQCGVPQDNFPYVTYSTYLHELLLNWLKCLCVFFLFLLFLKNSVNSMNFVLQLQVYNGSHSKDVQAHWFPVGFGGKRSIGPLFKLDVTP